MDNCCVLWLKLQFCCYCNGRGVGVRKRVEDGESGHSLVWDHPLTPLSGVQQGLGLPAGTQLSDSLQALGGEAEASGVLVAASQTASLTLAVTLHPSEATLRAKLRPTLPAPHPLPPETSLAVQCGWEARYQLRLELHTGACELQGSGELQLDRRLQWQVVAESSCEGLQVRVPGVGGRDERQGLQAGTLLFNHCQSERDGVNPGGLENLL